MLVEDALRVVVCAGALGWLALGCSGNSAPAPGSAPDGAGLDDVGSGGSAGDGGAAGAGGAGADSGTAGSGGATAPDAGDEPDAIGTDAPGAEPESGSEAGVAGAQCATAVDVTATLSAGETYHGAATATAVVSLSCSTQDAAIAYLVLHGVAAGQYRLDVTADTSVPAALDAILAVKTGCATDALELACNGSAAFQNTLFAVPQDTDLILVLSGDVFAGGFDISLHSLPWCSSSYECGGFGAGKVCSPSGLCLPCASSADCPVGDCDAAWGQCAACTALTCASSLHGASCDPATGKCGCQGAGDCPPGTECGADAVCSPIQAELVVADWLVQTVFATDENIYYSHYFPHDVWVHPLAGGPDTLLSEAIDVKSFARDADFIYWVGEQDTGPSVAQRVSIAGGAPETLGVLPDAVVGYDNVALTDATHLFTLTQEAVVRIPLGGGAWETIAPGYFPSLAAGPSHIYLADWNIQRVPKSGGTLEPSQWTGSALVADDTHLYWLDSYPDCLRRATLAAGMNAAPSTLIDFEQVQPGSFAVGLAIGADAVYVGTTDNANQTIYKVNKATATPALVGVATSGSGDSVSVNSSHVYLVGDGIFRLPK